MEKVACPDSSVGALEHPERPAVANLYAVAGRFISVESGDGQSAELIRRYFAGWHVAPLVRAEQVCPDATIWVTATQNPPHGPPDFESFEIAGGGVCRTDGKTYFFENNGSAVRVTNDFPPYVEVWIGNSPHARERAALARLIFNASMTAMRRCGLFELHGAGLVEPDGTGVLIIGPSGSGKSTLATALTAAGWQYLSDDSLLLYSLDETVEARALRRMFAVGEPTVAVGLLDGYESHLSDPVPFDPQKRRFEPASVFPGRFVEACIPRVIFFPVITNESASQTRLLTQSETMSRLIRMCPWACYDKPAAQTHLSVLASLTRQATAYELLAGKDLFGDTAYADSYLRSRAQQGL